MTVHKLSAGDGYTYLTRQVASADELRPSGQSLADYYTARGNPPGVWLGGGAEVLGVAGTEVSEEQMRALFGAGVHPNAEAMRAGGVTEKEIRLGAAYPSFGSQPSLTERIKSAANAFVGANGRVPSEAERMAIAATESRRGRRAVAGFDLVFSPVKSVSVLWALGGPAVRHEVEEAHHEAVLNTIGWIEKHAAFTRTGRGGIAQVDTDGLVCAAFDHRESRSGDPDLHTHVAVANKVRGVDGTWRSLDARALYALGVAASERYNTRVEDALARRLAIQFEERPGRSLGKRPIREIVGVPTVLTQHFSRRRALIEQRLAELREEYRHTHGREPTRSADLQLAQQATLETREAKGTARTLAEQVQQWRGEALQVIGEHELDRLVPDATGRARVVSPAEPSQVHEAAARAVQTVAEQRSTWTLWNVHAEVERQTRGMLFADPATRDAFVESVVTLVTGPTMSIRISEPELVREPVELVRASDGQSVFVPHGSDRFTTSQILLAEDRLVDAGLATGAPHVEALVLEAALAIGESRSGVRLDLGQRALVEAFATSSTRLAVGIGPAGAGKTTAMRAMADAWRANGGRVVALGSSARAAQVLGDELGLRAENLHKFLYENHRTDAPLDSWFTLSDGDLVLVDEAGMAGTLHLDQIVQLATIANATVRLIGDPAQLASVEAGGALRLLEHEVGATHLSDLHRFTDPEEAAATLGLRAGEPAAIDFYEERDRVRSGTREAMLDAAYQAWARDIAHGSTSVLIAGSNKDVTALNMRARLERVTNGDVEPGGVDLRDGNQAGVGDWIVTRANARTLRVGTHSWVTNGDTWHVDTRHPDGSLSVRRLDGRGHVRLPADYVAESVDLAYAATVHRVQGITADTAHALITLDLTREGLYVASTRGRHQTTWYAATDQALNLDCLTEPEPARSARQLLVGVLARRSTEDSANDTIRKTLHETTTLPALTSRYQHAWSRAAHDILTTATGALAPRLQRELRNGPGADHLASVLAAATAKGANPQYLLRSAIALEDLDHVAWPALVLATRIQDHRHALGAATIGSSDIPLPWLPPAGIAHAAWLPYLRQRADLIQARAQELGSIAAAYREQHRIHAPEESFETPRPTASRLTARLARVKTARPVQPIQEADPAPLEGPRSLSPQPASQRPPGLHR